MDLMCYEEIKYNFIEQTNECNIWYEFFMKSLNVRDVRLHAAHHVSIVSIFWQQ
jgi:hypothetical protein